MNKNQIITVGVGIALTILAGQFNFAVPTADIQNGIIAAIILVYSLVAKDANGASSILTQKSSVAGIVGSLFWLVTAVFHVNLGDGVKEGVMAIILSLQGYYTLNHSSIVHEIKGTVGEPTPS